MQLLLLRVADRAEPLFVSLLVTLELLFAELVGLFVETLGTLLLRIVHLPAEVLALPLLEPGKQPNGIFMDLRIEELERRANAVLDPNDVVGRDAALDSLDCFIDV